MNYNRGYIIKIMEKVHVSYEEIHDIVADLSSRIFDSFDADVIIGIGGGGLLPARLFRSELGIPMYAVFCSFYEDNCEESKKEPQITQWLDETALASVRGKRILLVDEVCDSGATLEYCIEEVLRTCDPEELAVAVLHDKVRDKTGVVDTNVVHYFVGQYVEDVWLVYPWSSVDIHGTQDEGTDLDEGEDEENEENEDEDTEEEEYYTDDDEPLPMSRCVLY